MTTYPLAVLGDAIPTINTPDVRAYMVGPSGTDWYLDAALVPHGIDPASSSRVPGTVKQVLESTGAHVASAAWGTAAHGTAGKIYVVWKPNAQYNAVDYANIAQRLFKAAAEGFTQGAQLVMPRYRVKRVWPAADLYVYPTGEGIPASAPELAKNTLPGDLPPDAPTNENLFSVDRSMATAVPIALAVGGGLVALGGLWWWYQYHHGSKRMTVRNGRRVRRNDEFGKRYWAARDRLAMMSTHGVANRDAALKAINEAEHLAFEAEDRAVTASPRKKRELEDAYSELMRLVNKVKSMLGMEPSGKITRNVVAGRVKDVVWSSPDGRITVVFEGSIERGHPIDGYSVNIDGRKQYPWMSKREAIADAKKQSGLRPNRTVVTPGRLSVIEERLRHARTPQEQRRALHTAQYALEDLFEYAPQSAEAQRLKRVIATAQGIRANKNPSYVIFNRDLKKIESTHRTLSGAGREMRRLYNQRGSGFYTLSVLRDTAVPGAQGSWSSGAFGAPGLFDLSDDEAFKLRDYRRRR